MISLVYFARFLPFFCHSSPLMQETEMNIFINNGYAYLESAYGWRIFPAENNISAAFRADKYCARLIPRGAVIVYDPATDGNVGSLLAVSPVYTVRVHVYDMEKCNEPPTSLPENPAYCTLAGVPERLLRIDDAAVAVYVDMRGRIRAKNGAWEIHLTTLATGGFTGDSAPGCYVYADRLAGALTEAVECGFPVSLVFAPREPEGISVVSGRIDCPRYIGGASRVAPEFLAVL